MLCVPFPLSLIHAQPRKKMLTTTSPCLFALPLFQFPDNSFLYKSYLLIFRCETGMVKMHLVCPSDGFAVKDEAPIPPLF